MQAKNGLFGFDLVPPFWRWLDEQASKGVLCSSTRVLKEIVRAEGREDALAKWAVVRKKTSMFVSPDGNANVQAHLTSIADYVVVSGKYSQPRINEFLNGADPWLIAHALDDGGTVVSNEKRVDPSSTKPKVPNVCSHFNVPCIELLDLLRTLGFKL